MYMYISTIFFKKENDDIKCIIQKIKWSKLYWFRQSLLLFLRETRYSFSLFTCKTNNECFCSKLDDDFLDCFVLYVKMKKIMIMNWKIVMFVLFFIQIYNMYVIYTTYIILMFRINIIVYIWIIISIQKKKIHNCNMITSMISFVVQL